MYSVRPIGLNLKDNDRDVPDGSLQESINMQWRDGAFKPIPERIISDIHILGHHHIILHKVSDENQINVLGFSGDYGTGSGLAFNLAGDLGGFTVTINTLEWFGTIIDGTYTPKAAAIPINVLWTTGMSFTILNGLIYFMGDGSSESEQYYLRLQYNESEGTYTTKDMYVWKNLVPYVPVQGNISLTADQYLFNTLTTCGIISVRFALVLKTGEVVLPSPVYGYRIYGINRSTASISKDDLITNIHTFVNQDLSFIDPTLFDNEISSINVYASVPYYITKILADSVTGWDQQDYDDILNPNPTKMLNEFRRQSEEVFYLVHSIDRPSNTKLLLTVGDFDTDIVYSGDFTKLDISTIAAGEIMPADNFTFHKLYGKITSYNGRLVVRRPKTVLSAGSIRSLAMSEITTCDSGFRIETEDGNLDGVASSIVDVALIFDDIEPLPGFIYHRVKSRGIMSYPDYRATFVGGSNGHELALRLYKTRKNNSHNMAMAYNNMGAYWPTNVFGVLPMPASLDMEIDYDVILKYEEYDEETAADQPIKTVSYLSRNRIQFSVVGEYSVWPALNSYRVGEGKTMNLGTGSVNPSESQIISPLIIGTTDGIYTANLDPSGNVFIASITKTKNIPMISEEILEIDMNIIFVSDQGLMVFSDGDVQNLTEAYFPQQGNGSFPDQKSIFIGYDLLTSDFFGLAGNPYVIDDIVIYLKSALLAYDGRRKNIWCSNAAYNFSLVYNLDSKQWGMSTLVFTEKPELFSILNTTEGEIYSRYMIKSPSDQRLMILSGEDTTREVFYHVMTRGIRFDNTDNFKVLPRMISRTMLVRIGLSGYVSFGLWGQQEANRYRKSIALALKKDNRTTTFPNNIRYHLPIDCRKGKYKTITVLQAGKALPESYISSFDFEIYSVNNTKIR